MKEGASIVIIQYSRGQEHCFCETIYSLEQYIFKPINHKLPITQKIYRKIHINNNMSNRVFITLSLFLFLFISNGTVNSPSSILQENSPSPMMEKIIDEIHFYGQSNFSYYIVAVSSPYDIFVEDFNFKIDLYVKGTKTTSHAIFYGCILTIKHTHLSD